MTATHCITLPHTATHCNARQHTATHYCTSQHTATHLYTLQCTLPQRPHNRPRAATIMQEMASFGAPIARRSVPSLTRDKSSMTEDLWVYSVVLRSRCRDEDLGQHAFTEEKSADLHSTFITASDRSIATHTATRNIHCITHSLWVATYLCSTSDRTTATHTAAHTTTHTATHTATRIATHNTTHTASHIQNTLQRTLQCTSMY